MHNVSLKNQLLTMRKILVLSVLAIVFISCKNNEKNLVSDSMEPSEEIAINYKPYGDEVSSADAVSPEKLREVYEQISVGDTINLKIAARVKEVCKKKGCWMRIELNDDEAMIRFKDYGFFMPLNIEGKEIIAEGKAFLEEQSVDKQRHYAEDAGASAEEVLSITEPKITYSFLAHGVLVPES